MVAHQSELIILLNEYTERFSNGSVNEGLKHLIRVAIEHEQDPITFHEINRQLWDGYSVVDVDLMISLLRRWLLTEPHRQEAKRSLGSYLLAHGPDWDEEGNALLQEACNLGGE